MRITRAGVGFTWVGAAVAFAACSGKTTSKDGDEAPHGGVESTPSGTAGARTAGGGTAAGGTPFGDSGASGADAGGTGVVAPTGGRSGTGGVSGELFGCGAVSCVEGESYCYNYTSGTKEQEDRAECRRLPEDCSGCACLCPPVKPDGQCSGSSDDVSASCLCGGETGKIVISCFGSSG